MKIQEWLDSGASTPLSLSDEQLVIYKQEYENREVEVQAPFPYETQTDITSTSVPAIAGYVITLKGDLELHENNLVFKHNSGYDSMNDKETNAEHLRVMFKEGRRQLLDRAFPESKKGIRVNTADNITGLKPKSISTDFRKKD
ncbi:MAG: hypothetical protein ABS904_00670 [Solibacillus isronensis]